MSDYAIVDCHNCDSSGQCHTASRDSIFVDRPYRCPKCNGTKKVRIPVDSIPIITETQRCRY